MSINKWLPLIGSGVELGGQIINAFNQKAANKRQEKFATDMYNRQRQDSLSDYYMQREYDSPSAQMERYKEAGLNPHLIYGQSNSGPAVRSTSAPSINPQAPQFSGGAVMGSYFDTQFKQAQLNNLEAQNAVIKQEAILKAAQTAGVSVGTSLNASRNARESQKFHLEESLNSTFIDAAKENLRRLNIGNEVALNENQRRNVLTAKSLREAAERVLSMRAQRGMIPLQKREIEARIRNLDRDGTLKDMEADLRGMNIHPGDPGWWRVLMKLIEQGKKLF